MRFAKVNLDHLRELARLGLAAHGGFHGGTGKPLSEYVVAGCQACAAIDAADKAVQQLEGRTGKLELLDLNLSGGRPQS